MKSKVYFSKELTLETKDNTVERVTNEIMSLIGKLDDKVNKSNYDNNKEVVDKITELLENNPGVKDNIATESLTKYDNAKTAVDNYKDNNGVVLGVSAGLAIVFAGLLYWIFKKEEK